MFRQFSLQNKCLVTIFKKCSSLVLGRTLSAKRPPGIPGILRGHLRKFLPLRLPGYRGDWLRAAEDRM